MFQRPQCHCRSATGFGLFALLPSAALLWLWGSQNSPKIGPCQSIWAGHFPFLVPHKEKTAPPPGDLSTSHRLSSAQACERNLLSAAQWPPSSHRIPERDFRKPTRNHDSHSDLGSAACQPSAEAGAGAVPLPKKTFWRVLASGHRPPIWLRAPLSFFRVWSP